MSQRLTFKVVRRRAWHDTIHLFDLHDRPKVFLRLARTAAALIASYLFFGWTGMMAGLGQVGLIVAPFAFVFLLWFLLNLWRAPVRLYNAGIAEVETLRQELQQSLEAARLNRPKVTLRAGRYNLWLRNDGGAAKFRAVLMVLDSRNWPVSEGPWQALWQRSRTNEVDIFRHEEEAMLLGSFSPTEGQPPGGKVMLSYFNLSRQEPAVLSTSYLLDEAQPRPWLRLQVSIFASPESETPIVRQVELGLEGITLLPDRSDAGESVVK